MPTPRFPRPGRYTLCPAPRRPSPGRLCTATLTTITPTVRGIAWADDIDAEELRGELPAESDVALNQDARSMGCRIACRLMLPRETCGDEPPPICQGTDWPPATSWERYAEERAAGERIPPSVSVWREQDRRRQAAAEREAREQAPEQPAALRVVAWGPSCEDERPVHRIGVRS